MTQDEIIDMARQAGLVGKPTYANGLVAFAKLVAQHEREACAKIIESHGQTLANGLMLTEAIRARGDNK